MKITLLNYKQNLMNSRRVTLSHNQLRTSIGCTLHTGHRSWKVRHGNEPHTQQNLTNKSECVLPKRGLEASKHLNTGIRL